MEINQDDPLRFNRYVTHLYLHVTDMNLENGEPWSDHINRINNKHIEEKGFSDIGYNWLIDPEGVLYEGRIYSSNGMQ